MTSVGDSVSIFNEDFQVHAVETIGLLAKPIGAGYSLVPFSASTMWLLVQLGFEAFSDFVKEVCKSKGINLDSSEDFEKSIEGLEEDTFVEDMFEVFQEMEKTHDMKSIFKELEVVKVRLGSRFRWAVSAPDFPGYVILEDATVGVLGLL
jgi:hypothetical protein